MKLTANDIEALRKVADSSHNACRVSTGAWYPEVYVHPSTAARLGVLGLAVNDRRYCGRLYSHPHLFIHLTEEGRKALADHESSRAG
jgi:hypothetical protein